jgi:hypothetical protein
MAYDDEDALKPPAVPVEPQENAPVRTIDPMVLKSLGDQLTKLFETYKNDRLLTEQKWLRNLRQYLGVYDPEIENQLSVNRSRAYPRLTRVKCISVLSRVMNLMFPGNERNWELQASPNADMSSEDVMEAVARLQQNQPQPSAPSFSTGPGQGPQITQEMVQQAVNGLAQERAEMLSRLIDDQLQELGGDQTLDYIALNRKVVQSGIKYGVGVLMGPFVREQRNASWGVDPMTGAPAPQVSVRYKPQFEFLSVWDFYPDLSGKTLNDMDGYFRRLVMTRAQVRRLANRSDFFGGIIKNYLKMNPQGNYKAQAFEQELRGMGTKANVNDQKVEGNKYEIIVWHGPVSGRELQQAGADVPEDKLADDIDAEVWMIGNCVIKADINPWRKIGADVKTIHAFVFDEDDSSPIGNGLPNVVRDSQMSVAAATRMLLDNAGIVCGPNLELNTDLLRLDQDLTSVHAYKMWYREGTGPEAQYPAIRNIPIDGHLGELLQTIDLFMKFADLETFVGPATGGEMQRGMGEPMRTAAGASMLRGDAALPFKDIIRNFDTFTQSVISSLVQFNRKFNPGEAPEGDYNVIARGATSLIAKEIRGIQIDSLVATMTPAELDHVDERKLVEARFAVRDMQGILVTPDVADQRKAQRSQQEQEMREQQKELMAAEIRKTLADAFKGVAQGQKNSASADAQAVNAALDIMEREAMNGGMSDNLPQETGRTGG